MRCRFIEVEKANHTITSLCRVMQVPRSTYYAWCGHEPSTRAQEDARLKPLIRSIHLQSRGTYGAFRVHRALRETGASVGRHRVARLMREEGLRARQRRKFKATTDSAHNHPIADNLLARDFTAANANTVWVGDITYVWTREGWLYLAVLVDLYSRRVVGWSLGSRMTQDLALNALAMACAMRRPPKGLLHHTDRGSQYASKAYQAELRKIGARSSMSRKGNCWDNAAAESFFATLKKEAVHGEDFATRDDARLAVLSYITWYNAHRMHSSIGFVAPKTYEALAAHANSAEAA